MLLLFCKFYRNILRFVSNFWSFYLISFFQENSLHLPLMLCDLDLVNS